MSSQHYANLETLRYYRYRRQFHEPDRRQMSIVIVGATLAICATLRNDFILLHGTSLLWISLAIRFVQLGGTVALLGLLRRAKNPRHLDWIGATWTILTALYLTVQGIATRIPVGEFIGPGVAAAAAITIFYFAQRGRLCGRALANAICAVELLVLLWHPSSSISKPARTTGTVVVLLLNVIGFASARSFEEQRRKRFEAERLERQARQELAIKNRELAQQKDKAEAMYRARTAFLAAMSHEFRTPMNAVIGLSDVLANAQLDREYREHARTIRDSASSLLVLLNDVLDFAKIDAGKLDISSEPFDLRGLLGSVVDMMQPAATTKKIELAIRFSTDIPDCLLGDDARLRQVLVNLLSNAIKFTSNGSVTFVVTERPVDELIREIGFSVEDTGIGMSADVVARLFRPFEQGDGSVVRRFGGTGLGLAISKKIVDAMGGDINVESVVGKGSTFSFAIRLAETTASTPSTATGDRVMSGRKPLAILVVDDLSTNRTVARVMLERLGYRAEFANDGNEAIELATKKDYDVIFMDLQMPGMSGIESAICIKEKLAGKRLPQIIAMTASVFEEDRAACRAAGMREFVAKPIDIEKLDAVLTRVSDKTARTSADSFNEISIDPAPLQKLRELEAFGEPGFVAELCREFLTDTPARIQRMKGALGRSDLKELELDAHSLKSSSATLGVANMSTLCATIESSARKGDVDGVGALLEQLAQDVPQVEWAMRREGLA